MRKFLLAATLLAAFAVNADARRGDSVNVEAPLLEPHTNISAKDWAAIMMRGTDSRDLVGHPAIDVVNATGSPIAKVDCHYNSTIYQLVGNDPYNNNPHDVPAWKLTRISTYKFENWCQTITATTQDGDTVVGHLFLAPTGTGMVADSTKINEAAFLLFIQ